ncbi:high-potential iron-sulfur protein [Oligoflexaceae bacterium]|nr:high-potential iron-sulfur protein [Oligoflexaceae bacterium]
MKQSQNRRQLLGNVARLSIASVGLMSGLSVVTTSVFAKDLKLVDPATNAIAKAIQYHHDATKAKRADKMGVKAAQQHCANCALYKEAGKIDGKVVGTCTMIAGVKVAAAGWCVSWVPGPKAKKS